MGLAACCLDRLRTIIAGITLGFLDWRLIEGIRVAAVGKNQLLEQSLPQLEQALALLRDRAPRIFRGVQRHLTRILILERGGEFYDHAIRAYMLDGEVLAHRSSSLIAMALVHEATHARLCKRGIKSTPESEARIEAICVSAEKALAERLPDSEALLEGASSKLSRPWWGAAQRQARIEMQLESLAVPRWIIRLRRALFRTRS
ncbi:MAG TPA: hypothetical protein VLK82_04100 [Candidatus Tectomicrobia bacterium]|nr:hypothetical protein [Candidatus Tectomicrobia bacterium]